MASSSMEPLSVVNGQTTGNLSTRNRGLQYGDGLFETIAVRNGRPQHWALHMQRLAQSCLRLRIPLPDQAQLLDEALLLCTDCQQGVLKIIWTRGEGGRGYQRLAAASPTRILTLSPWPDRPMEWITAGVTIRLCTMRLSRNERLAGMKHLNRLEQVLARNEWTDPNIAEGLMLDTENNLIEGTMTNVFLLLEGQLVTPEVNRSGVLGIARGRVLTLASALGLAPRVCRLGIQALMQAEEVFLCNSIIGVWPVKRILGDGQIIYPSVSLGCAMGELLTQGQG